MAKSPKEAIVIVLDVGEPAALDCDANGVSFLKKARSCVSMILQRKVFSESKDEVGLVLMGTEASVNSLNYKHISIISNLQLVTWEVIEDMECKTKPTTATGDWLDAIVVALDFLREQTEGKRFSEKKLVLLSNLAHATETQQLDIVMQSINDMDVSLVVIGPDLSQGGADPGKQLMENMVSQVNGIVANFEDALQQLMFYQKKAVRATAWNVVMDIGSTIKIPVSGYRKISSTALPTWKKAIIGGESAPLQERSYHMDDDMQTEVARSNIINGYVFGSDVIPIGDENEVALGYKSGPRALSVLGFTPRDRIYRHYLVGDATYYFVPQKGNQAAAEALSALICALSELNMVAIVRKVYNAGNAPVMGVLFPKKHPFEVLVYAELPFSEDMREFIFPSLPCPSKKEEGMEDATDQLIDAMLLEGDTLHPKNLADPHCQHWYNCLAQRALHPTEPLPPLAPHLASMLCCPLEDHATVASTLAAELRKYFPLEEVAVRQTRRAAQSVFKQEAVGGGDSQPLAEGEVKPLLDQLARDVVEVGTLSPADDFLALLKQGEPFPTVCEQMAAVIEKLVLYSFGQDDYGKAVEAMRVLRSKCLELNPQPYNQWLPLFRKRLVDNHNTAFLDLLKGDLGPISIKENPTSNISPQEAEKFFETSDPAQTAAPEDEMDEEDLFNQM